MMNVLRQKVNNFVGSVESPRVEGTYVCVYVYANLACRY